MDEQPLVSSPIVFFLAATVAIKPRRNVVETTLQAQTTRTAPVVVVGLRSVSRSAAPIVPPSETRRRKDAPHGWYRCKLSVPVARWHAQLRGAGTSRAKSSYTSFKTACFSRRNPVL